MAKSLTTCSKVALWLSFLAIPAGCQPATNVAPAEGIVTIDGQPLTKGRVQFAPIALGSDRFPGKAAYGKLQPDGRFVLGTFTADDGAVIGRHQVTLLGGEPSESQPSSFPKFALLRLVGKEFDVTPGDNRFAIELTSDFVRQYAEQDD